MTLSFYHLQSRANHFEDIEMAQSIQDKADELYNDPEWRKEHLKGMNAMTGAVDDVLWRMLDALPHAIKEQRDAHSHYSVQGILSCLHIIERQAKQDALKEARDLADADEL